MTTIVYKDGILAADRRVTQGCQLLAEVTKIFKNEKFAWGSAGTTAACNEFDKFINGQIFNKEIFAKEEHKNFAALVIDVHTKEVSFYDEELLEDKMSAAFFAIGSGSGLAKGALLMGATPKQAIEAAAKIDLATGSGIDEINLN